MQRLGVVSILVALLTFSPTMAQPSGVDRLYVFDCGDAHAPDQSRWSPGVNVGKPIDISDNCYLIHHAQGYLMWDTGVPDAVATMDGPMPGPIPWHRNKTLVSQLAAVGLTPDDIRYVAISHTHGDHVGNVDLFPKASVLIQQAEYDWAFALPRKPFSPEHPARKLDGDSDVFGDGSVLIVSTPGHTPGHQTLLVRLPQSGAVVLSGDMVHFQENWDARIVPARNFDKKQSVESMDRVARLLEDEHA